MHFQGGLNDLIGGPEEEAGRLRCLKTQRKNCCLDRIWKIKSKGHSLEASLCERQRGHVSISIHFVLQNFLSFSLLMSWELLVCICLICWFFFRILGRVLWLIFFFSQTVGIQPLFTHIRKTVVKILTSWSAVTMSQEHIARSLKGVSDSLNCRTSSTKDL